MMLMTAASSAPLIYDMATATEPPGPGDCSPPIRLLACALFGLAGSLVM
jgi:hypothetical protein